jgi:hypothetical protein
MSLLKYGGIALACLVIGALSSLMLFLCSTWLLESVPSVQRTALAALSLCGSGVTALMEMVRPPSAARANSHPS